jgi:hypothetical protein
MSFGSRLTHTVTIVRASSSGDPDDDDEYGQPVETEGTHATVKAAIQPLTRDTEQPLTTQAGAATADHRIYLFPMDITTADAIVHEAQACPMRPDLPDGRYEVTAVPDAAGLGHHLEVEARLIGGISVAGS